MSEEHERRSDPPRCGDQFVICIDNSGCPASSELGKVYRALADRRASRLRLVRVVDESREDYLFPKRYFARVRLTASGARAVRRLM